MKTQNIILLYTYYQTRNIYEFLVKRITENAKFLRFHSETFQKKYNCSIIIEIRVGSNTRI